MVELKEKLVKEIKSASDAKSVESIINNCISEMKQNGVENYRIINFIKRLDISFLIIEKYELTDKEWMNVKFAQKVLIKKIINGKVQDFVKNN